MNYGLTSKYRAALMGTAILFIMFCHLDIAQDRHGQPLSFLARSLHTFTVGVDIFLFLSGIGLYYSYTKKKDSYWGFEKRRLYRIMPYYFAIAGATYFLFDIIMKKLTAGKLFSDLFFVSWVTEGSTKYWYILAIAIFYLVFPLLYKMIHNGSHGFLKTLVFCLVWWCAFEVLLACIPFLGRFKIAVERLPIFVIGLYAGKLSYEKQGIKIFEAVLFLCMGYGAFILLKCPYVKSISENLYYPVRGLLAISIISTEILSFELLEKVVPRMSGSWIKLLSWFGGLTLELYLLHQSFMILFDFPYKPAIYLLAAFLLPVLSATLIYIIRGGENILLLKVFHLVKEASPRNQ